MSQPQRESAMASGSFPIPKNLSIAPVTPGLIDIPIERDVTPAQFTPAPVSPGDSFAANLSPPLFFFL